MNNKLLFAALIIVLLVGIFAVFATVACAKGTSLFCTKKQILIITLNDSVDMDKAKNIISKIPKIRILKMQYRDKEWSKMVNKMDLPNIDNPFKNEIVINIDKKADINEIYNTIKEIDFVEDIKYAEKQK